MESLLRPSRTIPKIRSAIPVPIEGGYTPSFVSFDNLSDGREHIALLFGTGNPKSSPLVRIHSECLTGDVFGSQRCECGLQLKDAIEHCAAESGIILYLRQEGRDIGLYNKFDAYKLQIENGLDTFAANKALGFPEDGRDYAVAAEMLYALKRDNIRLLTNNPDKAAQLTQHNIRVSEIIPTKIHINDCNKSYLESKRDHSNHTICLDKAKN